MSRFSSLSAGLIRHVLPHVLPMVALLAVSGAHADYFWIDAGPDGARVQAGELGKPASALVAQGARAFAADGKPVALTAREGGYGLAALPAGDLRFSASRAADKSLTLFHARFGRQETKAVSDLELTPTSAGGNVFRLYWKGAPVNATQVNVYTSEGWSRTLRPAADGTISFTPAFPALYVLEVSAKVNGAATVDGKKYDDIRHVATLSFRVGD